MATIKETTTINTEVKGKDCRDWPASNFPGYWRKMDKWFKSSRWNQDIESRTVDSINFIEDWVADVHSSANWARKRFVDDLMEEGEKIPYFESLELLTEAHKVCPGVFEKFCEFCGSLEMIHHWAYNGLGGCCPPLLMFDDVFQKNSREWEDHVEYMYEVEAGQRRPLPNYAEALANPVSAYVQGAVQGKADYDAEYSSSESDESWSEDANFETWEQERDDEYAKNMLEDIEKDFYACHAANPNDWNDFFGVDEIAEKLTNAKLDDLGEVRQMVEPEEDEDEIVPDESSHGGVPDARMPYKNYASMTDVEADNILKSLKDKDVSARPRYLRFDVQVTLVDILARILGTLGYLVRSKKLYQPQDGSERRASLKAYRVDWIPKPDTPMYGAAESLLLEQHLEVALEESEYNWYDFYMPFKAIVAAEVLKKNVKTSEWVFTFREWKHGVLVTAHHVDEERRADVGPSAGLYDDEAEDDFITSPPSRSGWGTRFASHVSTNVRQAAHVIKTDVTSGAKRFGRALGAQGIPPGTIPGPNGTTVGYPFSFSRYFSRLKRKIALTPGDAYVYLGGVTGALTSIWCIPFVFLLMPWLGPMYAMMVGLTCGGLMSVFYRKVLIFILFTLSGFGWTGVVMAIGLWSFFTCALTGLGVYAAVKTATAKYPPKKKKEDVQSFGKKVNKVFLTAFDAITFGGALDGRTLSSVRNLVGLVREVPMMFVAISAWWKTWTFKPENAIRGKDYKLRAVNGRKHNDCYTYRIRGLTGNELCTAVIVEGYDFAYWHPGKRWVKLDIAQMQGITLRGFGEPLYMVRADMDVKQLGKVHWGHAIDMSINQKRREFVPFQSTAMAATANGSSDVIRHSTQFTRHIDDALQTMASKSAKKAANQTLKATGLKSSTSGPILPDTPATFVGVPESGSGPIAFAGVNKTTGKSRRAPKSRAALLRERDKEEKEKEKDEGEKEELITVNINPIGHPIIDKLVPFVPEVERTTEEFNQGYDEVVATASQLAADARDWVQNKCYFKSFYWVLGFVAVLALFLLAFAACLVYRKRKAEQGKIPEEETVQVAPVLVKKPAESVQALVLKYDPEDKDCTFYKFKDPRSKGDKGTWFTYNTANLKMLEKDRKPGEVFTVPVAASNGRIYKIDMVVKDDGDAELRQSFTEKWTLISHDVNLWFYHYEKVTLVKEPVVEEVQIKMVLTDPQQINDYLRMRQEEGALQLEKQPLDKLGEVEEAFHDLSHNRHVYTINDVDKHIATGALVPFQEVKDGPVVAAMLVPKHYNDITTLVDGKTYNLDNLQEKGMRTEFVWNKMRSIPIKDANDMMIVPLSRQHAHLPMATKFEVLPDGEHFLWLHGVNPHTRRPIMTKVLAYKSGTIIKYIADNAAGFCGATLSKDHEALIVVGMHVRGNPTEKTCTASAITPSAVKLLTVGNRAF